MGELMQFMLRFILVWVIFAFSLATLLALYEGEASALRRAQTKLIVWSLLWGFVGACAVEHAFPWGSMSMVRPDLLPP